MNRSQRRDFADPNLIKPGDIVWLDAKHLTPTRGGGKTWPHLRICLYHYYNDAIPELIVSKTLFQFVCISSITKANPLNAHKQVLLNHMDPNLGLRHPSAACVDFSPSVEVRVEEGIYGLDGVRRITQPVVTRVPASPTLQAIAALFHQYWMAEYERAKSQ